VNRRHLLGLLGGSTVLWPLGGHAQQKAMSVIGFLSAFSRPAEAPTPQFRQALAEAGYVEGRNVVFEQRFAEADTTGFRGWRPI
jgi:putative tryptophan/tyrosine transport system substrate-binding protein